MKIITHKFEVGGRTLTLERGLLAEQAGSAIAARYGDTMVLVTVVASPLKQELDYFPLTVEYMERLYAGGKIKGSRWVKREGRPSDEEILSARLIDRSIRPLFPKGYKKDVQVIATVLSVDSENDPAVLAMVATSAALATSSIPWNGPVGSLKIGAKNGDFFANPTDSELDFSDLDLVLTTTAKNIFMIEAGARQVLEDRLLEALAFGQKEAQRIIDGISEFAAKVGVSKEKFEDTQDKELISLIDKKYGDQLLELARQNASKEGGADPSEVKKALIGEVGDQRGGEVTAAIEYVTRKLLRDETLKGKRVDGRKFDEIRRVSGQIGVLPRTHGSAIFARGQTQVLTVTTLGAPSLSQLIETAEGEETKRYIHHYSMPPYSIGETGRVGQPSRREIGHGALAERALLPVIPPAEQFPYTLRVVSEVMSSNGSTSMASTCGSTMSLMDAGVPIISPVSGVAMGLVIEGSKTAILSDIVGIEDGMGDMDFKIAGTKDGVTAIQLDVKTPLLTLEILGQALKQAREGRMFILDKMLEVISEARPKISVYAPKIAVVHVPVEKIGEVIGPSGRVIKKIMADTGVQVDVEDDGSVTISGISQESVERAREWIEGIVKEVQPGEEYKGIVKRVQPFGAFVEILPGKEGLVHVSDMSEDFVQDPRDLVREGDEVTVWVNEVDELKRINLRMTKERKEKGPRDGGGREGGGGRAPRSFSGGGFSRGRDDSSRFGETGRSRFSDTGRRGPRGGGRDRRPGMGRGFRPRRRDDRRDSGEGGPHFPASRFIRSQDSIMPGKKRF